MSELDFLTLCWQAGISADVQPEYCFAKPRRWRFDFAWPAAHVAVEFDGGQWVAFGGRHNRDSDREKLNHAAALGWRVLRFSNQQWVTDPLACLRLLHQALTAEA